jgi:hypothetical protein
MKRLALYIIGLLIVGVFAWLTRYDPVGCNRDANRCAVYDRWTDRVEVRVVPRRQHEAEMRKKGWM